MWVNKIVQLPKELPQTKKLSNVLICPGPQRALLIQTLHHPLNWQYISLEGSASSSSSSSISSPGGSASTANAAQDLLTVLLPGDALLRQRLGQVSSVHTNEKLAGLNETTPACITVGTVFGFVASFYWRVWNGTNPRDGQWILTALYRHSEHAAPAAAASNDEYAITSLWANDEMILAATDALNFSFWSRTTAGDTAAMASTSPKPRGSNLRATAEPVQLMAGKARGFCHHTVPLNIVAQTELEPYKCVAGVNCALLKSNQLKPDREAPTAVVLAPSAPGCLNQVVFALKTGAIFTWSYSGSTGRSGPAVSITIGIPPPNRTAQTSSTTILAVKFLDDSKVLVNERGLKARDTLVTLSQEIATGTVTLSVWKLDFTTAASGAGAGSTPKLILTSNVGKVESVKQAPAWAKLFTFWRSSVVLIALPHFMTLVSLNNGTTKPLWPPREDEDTPLSQAGKIITAIDCFEELGVILTAHGDLKMRMWSVESGGLLIKMLDMAGNTGNWISSTRLPLKRIIGNDPFTFVAMDAHCIYYRPLKKLI